MATQWFLRINESVHGPFDSMALRKLAAVAKIRCDTPIARDPQGPWHLAAQIRGLLPPSTGSELAPRPGPRNSSPPCEASSDPPVVVRVTPRTKPRRSTAQQSSGRPVITWLILASCFFAAGRAIHNWHQSSKRASQFLGSASQSPAAKPAPQKVEPGRVTVTDSLIQQLANGVARQMAPGVVEEWERTYHQARLRGSMPALAPSATTVEQRARELMAAELITRLRQYQSPDGTVMQATLSIVARESAVMVLMKVSSEFSRP